MEQNSVTLRLKKTYLKSAAINLTTFHQTNSHVYSPETQCNYNVISGCTHGRGGNVSFPDEAIRGINFFSAQINSFPYITSGRMLRKS